MKCFNTLIQFSIKPLLLVMSLFVFVIPAFAENDQLQEEQSQDEVAVCNPKVSISVQNKSRFEVLKSLAEDHDFSLEILESDDTRISLEKNQRLSKVIESITRDMNVVLRFKKFNDCETLMAISVLDNNKWGGRGGNSKTRNYTPTGNAKLAKPLEINKRTEEAGVLSSKDEDRRQQAAQLQKKRIEARKAKGEIYLNEEFEVDDGSKAKLTTKNEDWIKSIQDLPDNNSVDDMETYVQEVLDGNRIPDLRSMSTAERSKYMRIRRKLRRQ